MLHFDTPLLVQPVKLVLGELVSGNYFEVLDVRPVTGRLMRRTDDTPGAAPVTVISASFCRNVFGGSASPVGSTVQINGHLFEISGVARPEFRERIQPRSPVNNRA